MEDSQKYDIHHIVLTNAWYINAPCGDESIRLRLLEKSISLIGKKYGQVRGSNRKKGVHYIANHVHCSKRQVKLMLKSVPAPVIRCENACKYIFRCHIENYSEMYACILGAIHSLDDLQFEKELQDEVKNLPVDQRNYLHAFLSQPLSGLNIVEFNGSSSHIRGMAHNMIERLKKMDSEHPMH